VCALLRKSLPRPADARQQGFALAGVMIALIIATLASILAAGEIQRHIQDHAATSTGKYLLQVRDAVVDLQLKYEAWLSSADPSATPPVSTLVWTPVAGAYIAHGGIADLRAMGLLAQDAAHYPMLGDTARFVLVRQGTCPSENCHTSAYVYTCHPISSQRSLRVNGDCTEPAGERATVSHTLLGKLLLATEGYGGHDALDGAQITGPLMADVPRDWFDFGAQPGHAVLTAGLNTTPFGQFVRHGETRPVTLRNTLTATGTIQSDAGLLLNTAVIPGTACATPGLYAATDNKMLAVCADGVWFVPGNHQVTGVFTHLPHDATVPAPVCPSGLTPWRHVALQTIDLTVTGADINVAGSVGGTIQGSGSVNAVGTVTVNGAFAGSFSNAGDSYVRVHQRAALSGNRIVITPADMNARATVIQGCNG